MSYVYKPTHMAPLKTLPMLFACIALTLLPVLAFGASSKAYENLKPVIAQVDPIAGTKAIADELHDKSMAYWFIVLAVIAIGSWTWVFKWMVNQLEQQRAANAELTKSLVGYMEKDHAGTLQALQANTTILSQVVEKLKPH